MLHRQAAADRVRPLERDLLTTLAAALMALEETKYFTHTPAWWRMRHTAVVNLASVPH